MLSDYSHMDSFMYGVRSVGEAYRTKDKNLFKHNAREVIEKGQMSFKKFLEFYNDITRVPHTKEEYKTALTVCDIVNSQCGAMTTYIRISGLRELAGGSEKSEEAIIPTQNETVRGIFT